MFGSSRLSSPDRFPFVVCGPGPTAGAQRAAKGRRDGGRCRKQRDLFSLGMPVVYISRPRLVRHLHRTARHVHGIPSSELGMPNSKACDIVQGIHLSICIHLWSLMVLFVLFVLLFWFTKIYTLISCLWIFLSSLVPVSTASSRSSDSLAGSRARRRKPRHDRLRRLLFWTRSTEHSLSMAGPPRNPLLHQQRLIAPGPSSIGICHAFGKPYFGWLEVHAARLLLPHAMGSASRKEGLDEWNPPLIYILFLFRKQFRTPNWQRFRLGLAEPSRVSSSRFAEPCLSGLTT